MRISVEEKVTSLVEHWVAFDYCNIQPSLPVKIQNEEFKLVCSGLSHYTTGVS